MLFEPIHIYIFASKHCQNQRNKRDLILSNPKSSRNLSKISSTAMDLLSENTLPSAAKNFSSPIACLMIIFLHYLGCDVESIFHVIQAHDLGGTVSDVTRYIEEGQLSQYEFQSRPDGRQTYTNGRGYKITIEFANGRPVRYVMSSDQIRTIFPSEIVSATTPDGRQIITIVREGQVRCCAWDGEDFLSVWSEGPDSTQA